MKRGPLSGWILIAVLGAASVIPASAQQRSRDRDRGSQEQDSERGSSRDTPHYVDSADYDPQPYYVDGVEYKPYVPNKKSKPVQAPATDNVRAAPAPVVAGTPAPAAPELHPYVPPAASAASSSVSAAPRVAAASSSSSSTAYVQKKRQRYSVAIIEAVDKVTGENVRFAAPIGHPMRYKGLIYTARACETTADDEPTPDVIAYLQVRTNPAEATNMSPAVRSREIFHGWTFASTPSINPIQHPVYDAWVVACRQPLS